MTVGVAVVLSLAATSLRARQEANAAQARRAAILGTVAEVDPVTLEEDYAAYITERVFDHEGNEMRGVSAFELDIVREARKVPADRLYPVYEFEGLGRANYVVPLQGGGLWGPISAYLALESDLNTIYGVRFDHEKETPGLGAEIATPAFENRFDGKRLFDGSGEFTSVRVVKGGGSGESPHTVDALTGATMTTNGVTEMFAEELALYQQIFEELE
jgi:Na+-transporting NADH:ubiquinone oxidoreductase subunit C